jgi:hypothetical protein
MLSCISVGRRGAIDSRPRRTQSHRLRATFLLRWLRRFSITSVSFATMFSVAFLFDAACDAAEPKAPPEITAPARVYSAEETADFKKLTKAALEALTAGKQAEMVAKLTDLETAWDEKETALRPKDEATWTLLDKTLDKGISALRSSKTNLHKGKAALADLLKKFNQATKF